jgi:S-adenosylmethionine synthetase
MKRLITSESVSYGHPDKVSDQISDAILDAYLEQDPKAKVAVETMVKDNTVVLGGEVKSTAIVDFDKIVRNCVKDIGYTDAEHGFYYKNLTILNLVGKQSPEINQAVELADIVTAGDQGFMTGYATNETPNYMPLGMYISRKLVDFVCTIKHLGPDVKSQVTVEETNDGNRIDSILISTMHTTTLDVESVRRILTLFIKENKMELHQNIFSMIDNDTKIFINPAGQWNVGGPVSDCGLTGRKIVVDQYGPYCPVGGGAFSGKDPSKCDRSGAYLARYIAKNIVATGITDRCKVEIAYMIGVAEPASLNIDTFGQCDDEMLSMFIRRVFPMTPQETLDHFDLTKPMYLNTAKDGHFGNDKMPWEQLDKVDELSTSLNLVVEKVA